jgi:thioredoxin-related protein
MFSKILQLSILFVIFSSVCLSNDGFILDSIAEAEKLSVSTGQPILLIFGADYCSNCITLKKDILNKKVGASINRFIICYIDLEKKQDYKQKHQITMMPDSRILINSKTVSRMQGYSRHDFIKWIENVK